MASRWVPQRRSAAARVVGSCSRLSSERSPRATRNDERTEGKGKRSPPDCQQAVLEHEKPHRRREDHARSSPEVASITPPILFIPGLRDGVSW